MIGKMNKAELTERVTKLYSEIERREKAKGGQLQVGEVLECICEISLDKKEAVLLTALFTFADIMKEK
jgi:hypothetical protein